ncbi:MAG: hypothetical protein JKY89_02740 [Immundisolibacteraceae bacterium]|nr:hypothetical protein [Immundisolibacteraceae bacterium]
MANPIHWLLLPILVLSSTLAGAFGAPELPPPPDATVEIVASSASMNGIPITTRKFSVEMDIEEVLEFYRKLWHKPVDGHPGYTEASINEWQIVSRIEGDYLLTVQVANGQYGHSTGYLAISDYRKRARVVSSTKFPQMRESILVNDLGSSDPGKKAKTFLIRNEFSTSSNATYYRDHYMHRGWDVAIDQSLKGGHVLSFRRSGETVDIVVQHFGEGTYIVGNTVKPGLF